MADTPTSGAANPKLVIGEATRRRRIHGAKEGTRHPGWVPRDWPTPLPRSDRLRDFHATVDTIVR